jgi:hypothetical protein
VIPLFDLREIRFENTQFLDHNCRHLNILIGSRVPPSSGSATVQIRGEIAQASGLAEESAFGLCDYFRQKAILTITTAASRLAAPLRDHPSKIEQRTSSPGIGVIGFPREQLKCRRR